MEKYRTWIGWGAIGHAALSFLPIPLPMLPPSQWIGMAFLVPGIGMAVLTLLPMLLFAAGIGLIKGWGGGKKLFAIWAAIAGAGALAGLQYDPQSSMIDLALLGACLGIVFWGDWPKRR